MEKVVLKIYGDGEFWIDGQKRAKIYPDGEIWADGKQIARVYPDGDIWAGSARVGRVYPDGDLYIDNQKVAGGVYLLDLLSASDDTPMRESVSDNSPDNTAPVSHSADKLIQAAKNLSELGPVAACIIFVAILLAVAFIYGCFHFWFSDISFLLFGNMMSLGAAATFFVYAGMAFTMYRHIRTAIKKRETLFMQGLIMQAVTFFVNIIVFTVLDLIVTANAYGLTLGDALGEVGHALSGSLPGFLLIGVFVGMAPAIAGAFISFVYNKTRR